MPNHFSTPRFAKGPCVASNLGPTVSSWDLEMTLFCMKQYSFVVGPGDATFLCHLQLCQVFINFFGSETRRLGLRASKAPEKCHRLIAEIPYVCSAVGNLLENGQKTENVKMSARGLHGSPPYPA